MTLSLGIEPWVTLVGCEYSHRCATTALIVIIIIIIIIIIIVMIISTTKTIIVIIITIYIMTMTMTTIKIIITEIMNNSYSNLRNKSCSQTQAMSRRITISGKAYPNHVAKLKPGPFGNRLKTIQCKQEK